MKKKLPEWWATNRQYFEFVSNLIFLPKKIRKPFAELVLLLDSVLIFSKQTTSVRLQDIEIMEG